MQKDIYKHRHYERSAAIQHHQKALDCRATLVMTVHSDIYLLNPNNIALSMT